MDASVKEEGARYGRALIDSMGEVPDRLLSLIETHEHERTEVALALGVQPAGHDRQWRRATPDPGGAAG